MKVLGIDPGTAACGYGIVHVRGGRVTALASGCWTTGARERPEDVDPSVRERLLNGWDAISLTENRAAADEAEFALVREETGVSESVLSKQVKLLDEAGQRGGVVVHELALGVRGERPENITYPGVAEPLQQVWIAVRASLVRKDKNLLSLRSLVRQAHRLVQMLEELIARRREGGQVQLGQGEVRVERDRLREVREGIGAPQLFGQVASLKELRPCLLGGGRHRNLPSARRGRRNGLAHGRRDLAILREGGGDDPVGVEERVDEVTFLSRLDQALAPTSSWCDRCRPAAPPR